MRKRVIWMFMFFRVGLTGIYGNFFSKFSRGPQGEGKPKILLICFGLFSLYGAYRGFQAGSFMVEIGMHPWMPWIMTLFVFSLWVVILPAIFYCIDHPRGTRIYRLGANLRETPDKDGWPKISLE